MTLKSKLKKKLPLLIVLAVVLLGAGAWYFLGYRPKQAARRAEAARKLAADGGDLDRTYRVRRDDLSIGLIQGGYINASKKHKLSLQANYRTKLLWVIDENTKVKAGQLLAKFETDELKEKIEELEIDLDNLRKELDIAQENERIQISTNIADQQAAEERLSKADDALRKYRRFERANKRDSLDLEISKAQSTLNAKKEAYETTRDSEVKTEKGKDEDLAKKKRQLLKDAQAEIENAENALQNAENNWKVFRRYDHPSQMKRLLNELEQAELNLRKVKISNASKLVQSTRSINNYKRRIRRTEEQLKRYKSYMEMMELTAPADGVVIYGDPDRNWNRVDVKTGLEVWKGLVLLTIPEMSNLVVEFDLPELYRTKIKVGDTAALSPDSLPGEKFYGKVSKIDTLPTYQISWDTSSPKIYKSRISLDQQSPKLVNGMSVQLNVVTKVIPQTLFVQVEAVFEDNDRFFVYRGTLTGPKETEVKIGDSNDNFVQITDGLEEGDIVYLYRPYQKTQDSK